MGIWLIKISVVYLFIGTALGMFMSISGDYTLSSVHTHMTLLGWTTMTLAGLIYHLFPEVPRSTLRKILFFLFNIGLPVMLIGMALYLSGFNAIVVLSIGATITSIAILLFTIDILTGLRNVSDVRKNEEQ